MEDISLLYESVLISEMSEDVIDYIDDNKQYLPFSDLFDNKLRLVIPIGGDLTAKEIMDDLSKIKDFSGVDLETGEVIRKIKLDPKYGKGEEKEQKINIGKAVSALKIDPAQKKKYLDWLAKYKDNLEMALSDISDYVIILSRAPVDVVRMSDHRNISSCHSQGNGYFQCAVQEAVTGGAVAYVVDREDLESWIPKLQEKDFFQDNERGIQGIRPISRLRVRRLESRDGRELAVPDTRIYGDSSVSGFYKYLAEFLKSFQSAMVSEIEGEAGWGNTKWDSRGGTYFDSSIDSLLDDWLGSSPPKSIRHDSDDESSEGHWKTRSWEPELERIKDNYNSILERCSVDYYIEENDDHPHILPSGGCDIDISGYGLPEDMELTIEDYDAYRKARDGLRDDEYMWSYILAFLGDMCNDNIGYIKITSTEISFSFYDENSGILNSPEQFDSEWCYGIKSFDQKLERAIYNDELVEAFTEAGFISTTSDDSNFSRFNDYLENGENYNIINVRGGRINDLKIEFMANIMMMMPMGEPESFPKIDPNGAARIFNACVEGISQELFHPKITTDAHPTFKQFYENYNNAMEGIYLNAYNLKYSSTHFTQSTPKGTITNDVVTLGNIGEADNKLFEYLDFIDEMAPHIANILKMIALIYIQDTDPELFTHYQHHNLPNLMKVYGKYIK